MYFDNLTIVSLVVFAVAFGSFIYACIVRGCLTEGDSRKREEPEDGEHRD